MKKWIAAALCCLMMITTMAGCKQKTNMGLGVVDPTQNRDNVITASGSYEEGGLTVTDYFGDQTVLKTLPERIAVVSGTPLVIWYDLGGDSICTSDIDDNNLKLVEGREEEMLALPNVGPVYSLNMEAVVAQDPQLIITQAGVQSTVTESLREMGYPVISVMPRDFEEVLDCYRVFGAILNKQDLAEEKIAALTAEREDYLSKAPAEGKKVVMLYLTASSLSVKLDSSIAGSIAKDLGIQNIASNLPPDTIGSENTPLDIEYIVQQDPDMILVTSMIGSNELAEETMEKHFAENKAWSTVPAVTEGKVYYLPQQYFLYNAGPYFNEAVHYMASTVYPEIYGEVSSWYAE